MTSEGSQKIDWSEIMAAAKAVQEQHGLSEYFYVQCWVIQM